MAVVFNVTAQGRPIKVFLEVKEKDFGRNYETYEESWHSCHTAARVHGADLITVWLGLSYLDPTPPKQLRTSEPYTYQAFAELIGISITELRDIIIEEGLS